MEQASILEALISTLEGLERNESVTGAKRTLSELLRDELEGISNHLRIASLSGKAVAYPTPFPINPTKEMFFTSFDLDASRDKHDYPRRVPLGSNGFCEIRIAPAVDAEWDDPEIKGRLNGLSRFLEIILERKIMLENAARLPLIDMASGLWNSTGTRSAGGQLLAKAHPEDYVGIFMNLKDTKLVASKYSERLIEQFLISVSHKLISFLDTDAEIGAHYGGDNFYVLLLKERLQDFVDFLKDAVVEVRLGEETQTIPFFARMGIYEGKPGDHIGMFMTNASIAFQMTRRTGQDQITFRPEMAAQLGVIPQGQPGR